MEPRSYLRPAPCASEASASRRHRRKRLHQIRQRPARSRIGTSPRSEAAAPLRCSARRRRRAALMLDHVVRQIVDRAQVRPRRRCRPLRDDATVEPPTARRGRARPCTRGLRRSRDQAPFAHSSGSVPRSRSRGPANRNGRRHRHGRGRAPPARRYQAQGFPRWPGIRRNGCRLRCCRARHQRWWRKDRRLPARCPCRHPRLIERVQPLGQLVEPQLARNDIELEQAHAAADVGADQLRMNPISQSGAADGTIFAGMEIRHGRDCADAG